MILIIYKISVNNAVNLLNGSRVLWIVILNDGLSL